MMNKQLSYYQQVATSDEALSNARSGGSIFTGSEVAQPQTFMPEKYQVVKQDGSLDLEQSARKLSDGYNHLEKRLGSGDIPPRQVQDYDIDLHSELLSFDDFKQGPENIEFLKKAHELGMSQKQLEFVLSEYAERLPELAQMGKELNIEDAGIGRSLGYQVEDVKKLMMSEAYPNPSHPDHKSVHEQVRQYYQTTYGNGVIS